MSARNGRITTPKHRRTAADCRVGIKAYRGPASAGPLKSFLFTGVGLERLKWSLGPEEVERAVEDATCREAQEPAQKTAKRKFSRGQGKPEKYFTYAVDKTDFGAYTKHINNF